MEPREILDSAFQLAEANSSRSFVSDRNTSEDILFVVSSSIKAPIRILLSCLLAKIHQPAFDVRKPFSEIGGADSFSGRSYDEAYVTDFIDRNRLKINRTTGYLTPAFRTKNIILSVDTELKGRNPQGYKAALRILDVVHREIEPASSILNEILRILVLQRDEAEQLLQEQLKKLERLEDESAISLSSEGIVGLISGQLAIAGASRLPVLLVAAAYNAVGDRIGEQILSLNAHNAADSQTGAAGDVEVTLVDDDRLVTVYEMKMKRVLESDIHAALQKLTDREPIDNYIFITTDYIDPILQNKASNLYSRYGIEFVILDCLGFVKHFLHFFHRYRIDFLNAYQSLILAESDSALSQEQKQLWLAARIAAEKQINDTYTQRQGEQ